MLELPLYVPILFVLSTALIFCLFWKASGYSKTIFWWFLIWLMLQSMLGFTGFYLSTEAWPPRILFTFFPTFLLITVLFLTKNGKSWISKLDLAQLTLLHVVRIPVELVLYYLFLNEAVPELMTFSGRNFDILAGITAPFVYYFGFITKTIQPKLILIWNIVCLGLLVNIVVNALLSASLPFQQFAFDRPNIAVLYFPFNWLPAFVVPLVLFSHLTAIKKLVSKY